MCRYRITPILDTHARPEFAFCSTDSPSHYHMRKHVPCAWDMAEQYIQLSHLVQKLCTHFVYPRQSYGGWESRVLLGWSHGYQFTFTELVPRIWLSARLLLTQEGTLWGLGHLGVVTRQTVPMK